MHTSEETMKKRSLGKIIVEGRDYETLKEMDRAADRESMTIFMICIIALTIVVSVCLLIQWTWDVAGMAEDWPGMRDAPVIMLAIVSFMMGATIFYGSVSKCIKSRLNQMCDEAFGYTEPKDDEEEPLTTNALSEKVEE